MPISALVQTGIFLLLTAAVLFGFAGTLALPGFWIYFATIVVFSVLMLALLPADLIQERMRPAGKRTPARLQLVSLVVFGHWALAGLDHGRFHWSDSVPVWLQGLGLVMCVAGWGLFFWAMRVNRFFSSIVRIQTDRGQHVIDTGPYAVIRHPGYAAAVLLIAGSGLALSSWLASGAGGRGPAALVRACRRRGSRAAGRACRLSGLCRAGALADAARRVVIPTRHGSIRIRHIMEHSI